MAAGGPQGEWLPGAAGRADGRVRIGTSGWHYAHWRGLFYPPGLPSREWLAFYAAHFDAVELNNTFYQLPPAERFDAWRSQVPPDFVFAVKLSRFVTHRKRLLEAREPLRSFARRVRRLGPHLGPVLVQLPPRFRVDPERLRRFLGAAPRSLRLAVEFRDPSWLSEEVFRVLRGHGAALCVHDLLPDHPFEVTADTVYLRFHGTAGAYGGGYSPQRLAAVARRLAGEVRAGREVHAYFNNDVGGFAVRDAAALRRFLERRVGGGATRR